MVEISGSETVRQTAQELIEEIINSQDSRGLYIILYTCTHSYPDPFVKTCTDKCACTCTSCMSCMSCQHSYFVPFQRSISSCTCILHVCIHVHVYMQA